MEYNEDKQRLIERLNFFIKNREMTVDFQGTAIQYVLFAIKKWNQKNIDKLTFFNLECTDDQLEILNRRYMTRRMNMPDISYEQLLAYKESLRQVKKDTASSPEGRKEFYD